MVELTEMVWVEGECSRGRVRRGGGGWRWGMGAQTRWDDLGYYCRVWGQCRRGGRRKRCERDEGGGGPMGCGRQTCDCRASLCAERSFGIEVSG